MNNMIFVKSSMNITVISLKEMSSFTKNYYYLIFDDISRECLLIDPAGEMDKLDKIIKNYKLSLKAVLITHTHPDHVGLAELIMRKHGCRIMVSEKEDLRCFSSVMDKLSLINTEAPMQIGRMIVTPIHTPGHTMGSICYLVGNNLFTGDTLFIEGCGMCFSNESDPKLLFSSLNKLKSMIHPHTKIFPGHSFGYEPGQQFDFLLNNNIYLNFAEEDMFVSYRMRKGQTRLFDFH